MRNLAHRMLPASEPFYPFPIDYAAKFSAADTTNLTATIAASTSAQKWTFSAWLKRVQTGAYHMFLNYYRDSSRNTTLNFSPSDEFWFHNELADGQADNIDFAPLFRDPSNWFHLVVVADSTIVDASERVKVWINGVRHYSTSGTLDQNDVSYIGSGYPCYIGSSPEGSAFWNDGYLADAIMLPSQTLDETYFGEFVGNTWVPKQYTGPYTDAGAWHLDFSNASDLGEDSSGNGNDFTNNGVEQTTDTPTNNYPTFDSLVVPSVNIVSEAGTKVATSSGGYRAQPLTIPIPQTGKWQIEFNLQSTSGRGMVGVFDVDAHSPDKGDDVLDAGAWGYFLYDGSFFSEGVADLGYGDAVSTAGKILGITYDADTGDLECFVDGASQGVAVTLDTSRTYVFYASDASGTVSETWIVNNDAEGFDYPITGALPICTANWPASETPVIDSEQGFVAALRDGNGGTFTHTGIPFAPKLAWLKRRDAAANNYLYDTERGAGKYLLSNGISAEGTAYPTEGVTAFNSDGITIVDGANLEANVNESENVDWLFNMLPAYGMDIVTYTGNGVAGRTVAHNLGAPDELRFVKRLDATGNWLVGCQYMAASAPWNYRLALDLTVAAAAYSTIWNNTAPTASVFSLGTEAAVNANGGEFVAYLFRSVPGFLKVGYYIGNGNANGPRIYTGFRPRYILQRNVITAGASWTIHDSERQGYNVLGPALYANLSNAESTDSCFDFLSNGFKLRAAGTGYNGSSTRHIYLAIGDPFPFVNAF